jgi:hypothetical protein
MESLTNYIKEERHETQGEKVLFNSSLYPKEKDAPVILSSKVPQRKRPTELSININNYPQVLPNNPSTPSGTTQNFPQKSNVPIHERRGSTLGFFNKGLMKSNTVVNVNIANSNTQISLNENKMHKVSLKNSLNHGKVNFSKFEVNIQETPDHRVPFSTNCLPIFQASDSTSLNHNPVKKEIEIIFIVHKGDWNNGKSKIIKNLTIFNNFKIPFRN